MNDHYLPEAMTAAAGAWRILTGWVRVEAINGEVIYREKSRRKQENYIHYYSSEIFISGFTY